MTCDFLDPENSTSDQQTPMLGVSSAFPCPTGANQGASTRLPEGAPQRRRPGPHLPSCYLGYLPLFNSQPRHKARDVPTPLLGELRSRRLRPPS